MPHVEEFNQIEQLERLRPAWDALLENTPVASFFHSLDWLQAYWQHFGRDQKLRVLVVHDQGAPIGIVPLTVVREPTRVGRLRVLTYPLHDWASFYGPLGPRRRETLTCALRHLQRVRRDWDMIDLRWGDLADHEAGGTRRALDAAGFPHRTAAWKRTQVIDSRGSWDDYLASRTSKFRNNLRRNQKRLSSLGEVQHVCHRPRGAAHGDDDPRWDLFQQCVDVARKSWQGASQTGTTLSHQRVHDFLRQTHALAARSGMLDLHLLRAGGNAIAFTYNYHFRGSVYGLRMGYDPAYAWVGAGSLMCARTFQQCFDRGDHTIDLGNGSSELKRAWCTGHRCSYRYTHYPLSAPQSQLLRLKHCLQAWLA